MDEKTFDLSQRNSIILRTLSWDHLAAKQLHTGNFVEINFVVSGRGIHRILDQTVPCKEGDLCVLSPQTFHGYEAENPDSTPTVCRILFDPKIFFGEGAGTPENPGFCFGVFCEDATVAYATLNKETREEIETYLQSIAHEIQKDRPYWQNAVGAHLSILLITLNRYINGAIRNLPQIPQKDRALITSALRIINEDFSSETLTLESLSTALFVSPAQFSRVFKSCIGKSFSDYLKHLRMAHACQLLKETDLTTEQILSECGLRDLNTFYRSFQSYTKMTPGQYRNRYHKTVSKESQNRRQELLLHEISESIKKGKAKAVSEGIAKALDLGCSPTRILDEGLLAGMNIVGEKFKNGESYVPEVLVAARAMNAGIAVLKPHLAKEGTSIRGKVCIGTVQGDLHDIGKNLVKMMLEGKGLEVIDLGVDVPPEVFAQTAKEQNCQVICCSAPLTSTISVWEDEVRACQSIGIRAKVKIMARGAPVNQELCDAIGADCYTSDAASAADAAATFCQALL